MPVPCRTPPSPRKDRVNKFEVLILRPVPKRREIGDQTHIPKQQRNGSVGGHRKNVPNLRTTKLRPNTHCIWIREQPVCRKPGASSVEQWKHGGAGHRE